MTTFQSFEKAFQANVGSCRATCKCGAEFYDTYNNWDFEEGEFENLQKDPLAKGVDHAIGYVEFEGSTYVADCNCWHERAKQLIKFFNAHANAIAEFLTLEKKRKQAEVDASPVVKG